MKRLTLFFRALSIGLIVSLLTIVGATMPALLIQHFNLSTHFLPLFICIYVSVVLAAVFAIIGDEVSE